MNTVKSAGGFTLIELMIVVVIVAILAMIAYPSYSAQVRKTARKEAAGIVLEVAARLERIRSQSFAYPSAAADLAALSQTTRRYGIAVASDGATFTITSTPSGDQVDDMCGTFTYSEVGAWCFGGADCPVAEADCL